MKTGAYLTEGAYYYRDELVSSLNIVPSLNPNKKYYFLDDTVLFNVNGYNLNEILNSLSADTMYFKVIGKNCFFYIDDLIVDTIKLGDLEAMFTFDIACGWNTRKYRIIRDSVANARNK